MTLRYALWLCACSVASIVAALCVLSSVNADEPNETPATKTPSAPGDLTEDQIARAKALLASWDRPAPKLELTEKWRVTLPIEEFSAVAWAVNSDRLAVLTLEQEVLILDAIARGRTMQTRRSAPRRDRQRALGVRF